MDGAQVAVADFRPDWWPSNTSLRADRGWRLVSEAQHNDAGVAGSNGRYWVDSPRWPGAYTPAATVTACVMVVVPD